MRLDTGFCRKSRVESHCHWRSVGRILGKGCVMGIGWIFFALLKAQYTVCAMTPMDQNCSWSLESKKGEHTLFKA